MASGDNKGAEITSCNCTVLRRASRLVSQFYDQQLAPAGVRVTQFAILRVLAGSNGYSINELADRLNLDRTTADKNLQPLEKARLVRIVGADNDARARQITLTASGAEKLRLATTLWRTAQSEFERANGPKNSAKLRQALQEIQIPQQPLSG